jgi:hypothetical protein
MSGALLGVVPAPAGGRAARLAATAEGGAAPIRTDAILTTPSNMQNCYNQTLDAVWFASHSAFGGRTPFAWSSSFLVAR